MSWIKLHEYIWASHWSLVKGILSFSSIIFVVPFCQPLSPAKNEMLDDINYQGSLIKLIKLAKIDIHWDISFDHNYQHILELSLYPRSRFFVVDKWIENFILAG